MEILSRREEIYAVSPVWADAKKRNVGDPPQDKKIEAEFWVGLGTRILYSSSI